MDGKVKMFMFFTIIFFLIIFQLEQKIANIILISLIIFLVGMLIYLKYKNKNKGK